MLDVFGHFSSELDCKDKYSTSLVKVEREMREIIWSGFICDVHDLLSYLNGEIAWERVRKREVKFLVDTGASKSVVLEEAFNGLRVESMGMTVAHGICDKPVKFKRVLAGVAVDLEGEVVASVHEVLVPAEDMVGKRLRELLSPLGASAILGRLSLDSLNLGVHPTTLKPVKIPTLLL